MPVRRLSRTCLSRGQGHQAALLTAVLTRRAAASGERGNVLAVGNYCYVAVYSAARGASAPTEGGEGRGHIVAAARLQLVLIQSRLDYTFQRAAELLW